MGAEISRYTGEFTNTTDENAYRAAIWKVAAQQAQYGLVAAVFVLTFSFLPAFLGDGGEEQALRLGFVKIILLATAASIISVPQTVRSLKAFQWLIAICAIIMAVTDAAIIFSAEIAWREYLLVVTIEIVFFTLFIPNIFALVLMAGIWLYSVFVIAAWQMADDDKVELALFCLALLVFAGFCLMHHVRTNRRARRNYYKTKATEASKDELEQYVLDLNSERQAVENAASENVLLMEELTFARQDAEEKSVFLKAVLDNISQGVSVFDRDFNLVVWNRQFKDILELPEDFLAVGRTMEDLIRLNAERGEYGEGDAEVLAAERMRRIEDENEVQSHDYERRRANGAFIEVRGRPMPSGGLVTTYADITERKKNEEIIRRMAMYDSLTGLANRNHFNQKLREKIAIANRDRSRVALAMLDLDGFKPVNDTYGHPAGDNLLKQVAHILLDAVREVDIVARLGGDEFAIIFHGIEDKSAIDVPLRRIIKNLLDPMRVEGHTVQISASIGVGFLYDDANDLEVLIRVADEALYEAKNAGKGCYVKAGGKPVRIDEAAKEKATV